MSEKNFKVGDVVRLREDVEYKVVHVTEDGLHRIKRNDDNESPYIYGGRPSYVWSDMLKKTEEPSTEFRLTHMLGDIELMWSRIESDGYVYVTAQGRRLVLPEQIVNKHIIPVEEKPQPGEVWRYTGPLVNGDRRLELVNLYGHFLDINGDLTSYEGNEKYYEKVFNADGSPA